MTDAARIPPEPENPYPRDTVAGRAWEKGLNARAYQTAYMVLTQSEKYEAELAALRADLARERERAEKAEATCKQSLQVAEPTKDAAHEVAELLWSELYGVRRWVMDECATDLNEIVWDVLKFYHERHIAEAQSRLAVTDDAVERARKAVREINQRVSNDCLACQRTGSLSPCYCAEIARAAPEAR